GGVPGRAARSAGAGPRGRRARRLPRIRRRRAARRLRGRRRPQGVTILSRDGRPLVIGHRGAPVLAPENTLESFEAAVAAGADAVEFDVAENLVIAHSLREQSGEPLVLDDV